MVVVKIGDGLGNQMFNYVCGYSVAKHDNDTLLLDTSEVDNSSFRSYGLDQFNIDYTERESFSNKNFFLKLYKRIRRNLKYNVIMERKDESIPLDMSVYKKKRLRNKYLYGYFQNLYYFNDCRDDIIRQFTPSRKLRSEVDSLIERFAGENLCSLHIRGGDITPLSLDYYAAAVGELEKRHGNIKYIIFSNVHDFAEDYIKKLGIDAKFIWDLGKFTDVEELFLMKACTRHILSDSTFSRWAALLDERGGEVVAPPSMDAKKIYMPEWIVIDNNGNGD